MDNRTEFNYLDIEMMETICHKMAIRLFDKKDDPIAAFQDHDPQKLESALGNPRQTFASKDLYLKLEEKATILWYSINKNHPFSNGNKRISTAAVLVFLFINGHWLDAGINEMVNQALYIAKSFPEEKDNVLKTIQDWINKHLIKEG